MTSGTTGTKTVRGRRLYITALLLLATLGASEAVYADHTVSGIAFDNMVPTQNYGSQCSYGAICRTDNTTFEVFMGNLGPVMTQETSDTLNGSYTTTDLNVAYTSSPTYTGSAETDLIYNFVANANMPVQGVPGVVVCDDPSGTYVCDQFYVYYQAETVNAYINDRAYLQKLACHETGHGTGLVHGGQSYPAVSDTNSSIHCMKGGYSTTQTVGPHNAWQINQQY